MLVFLDLETRSRCDIKTAGGNVYVRHESTELLCGVAIIMDKGPYEVCVWSPHACIANARWKVEAEKIRALGLDPSLFDWRAPRVTNEWFPHDDLISLDATFVAHNGEGFDRPLLEHHGFPVSATWVDTMHKARQSGLPAGLNAIGEQLFDMGKDKTGQDTLKRLYGVRTKGKKKGTFQPPTTGTLGVVARYCALDVLLMTAAWVSEKWGEPHPDDAVLATHVAMDRRGLAVDLPLAHKLLSDSERLKEVALSSVEALGLDKAMVSSNPQLGKWLAGRGLALPNCQKVTLQLALEGGVVGDVATVINARLACNRVTMGKAKAAIATTCPDGRMRGSVIYWGAHTGRWAGRGFQTQNLTAPVKGFNEGCYDEAMPATMAALGSSEEDILASMLRGIITAGGRNFAMIDYNQIEARVLLWMCGDETGLQVFRDGLDIYRVAAAGIYGVAYDSLTKGSLERLVGKVATLALGYQGGPGALSTFAEGAKLNLEDEGIDAEETVNAWRDANTLIAGKRKGVWVTPEGNTVVTRSGGLWKDAQKAAKLAILGQPMTAGRCLFRMKGPHLTVTLPSGRPLVYRHAKYIPWEDSWGGTSPAVTFVGVRYGKACREATYGGRIVENCLAGDTPILTHAGWKALDSLSKCDTLWDGEEWVSHEGLVNQGEQEVGAWLGVRTTGSHMILAGMKWSKMTLLDAGLSQCALDLGLALAPSLWPGGSTATDLSSLTATVGSASEPPSGPSAGERSSVGCAPTGQPVSRGRRQTDTRVSSPPKRSCPPGDTGIPEWSHAAQTPTTELGPTTAAGVSLSTRAGLRTERFSTATQRPSTTGTRAALISTVSTTRGIMSREICGSSPGLSTPTTGGEMLPTPGLGENGLTGRYVSNSAPSGPSIPLGITSIKGETLSGLWHTTGQREVVYDILNCGPRSRFMILTALGPVISHNCTQAIARDVMGEAMVSLEAAGLDPAFTVHDEVICEIDSAAQKADVVRIMTTVPTWATGLPLAAEGEVGERYGK